MFGFIKGAIAEFDFNVFGSLEESLVNLDAMGDLIQDIVSGKITDKELLAIGINEAVGDLHYVIKNWHIVSNKKTYSNETVYKFGKHLAGAYGEMVRAVATVVGAVKSVKALKAKIKGAGKAKNTKPSNAKGARNAGKGFETFNDLKKYLGSPGEGNQWHQIVEQSQIKKSGFVQAKYKILIISLLLIRLHMQRLADIIHQNKRLLEEKRLGIGWLDKVTENNIILG